MIRVVYYTLERRYVDVTVADVVTALRLEHWILHRFEKHVVVHGSGRCVGYEEVSTIHCS